MCRKLECPIGTRACRLRRDAKERARRSDGNLDTREVGPRTLCGHANAREA
jgi:hypothetical protein